MEDSLQSHISVCHSDDSSQKHIMPCVTLFELAPNKLFNMEITLFSEKHNATLVFCSLWRDSDSVRLIANKWQSDCQQGHSWRY